jgi:hypothetical protein
LSSRCSTSSTRGQLDCETLNNSSEVSGVSGIPTLFLFLFFFFFFSFFSLFSLFYFFNFNFYFFLIFIYFYLFIYFLAPHLPQTKRRCMSMRWAASQVPCPFDMDC